MNSSSKALLNAKKHWKNHAECKCVSSTKVLIHKFFLDKCEFRWHDPIVRHQTSPARQKTVEKDGTGSRERDWMKTKYSMLQRSFLGEESYPGAAVCACVCGAEAQRNVKFINHWRTTFFMTWLQFFFYFIIQIMEIHSCYYFVGVRVNCTAVDVRRMPFIQLQSGMEWRAGIHCCCFRAF